MSEKVKTIPQDYHNITPYLTVNGADKAIEFYKKVFDAEEVSRFEGPDGKIGHAELKIGDSKIMLGEECEEMKSPKSSGGFGLHLYVEDADVTLERAVKEGAKNFQPIEDKFYGDRSAGITDPFGHNWFISTHIENVSSEELHKRAAKKWGLPRRQQLNAERTENGWAKILDGLAGVYNNI